MSPSSTVDATKLKRVITACERDGCMDALMHLLGAINLGDSKKAPTSTPAMSAAAAKRASVVAAASAFKPGTPPKVYAGGASSSRSKPVLSAKGTMQSWIDVAKAHGEIGLYGKDCATKAQLQLTLMGRGWVFA
jgi:hypothetical protein